MGIKLMKALFAFMLIVVAGCGGNAITEERISGVKSLKLKDDVALWAEELRAEKRNIRKLKASCDKIKDAIDYGERSMNNMPPFNEATLKIRHQQEKDRNKLKGILRDCERDLGDAEDAAEEANRMLEKAEDRLNRAS